MDPAPDRRGAREHRKFSAGLREQLLAFARWAFELQQLQPDGKPLQAHLEAAAKSPIAGEEARRRLIQPPLPEAAAHVWGWFLELDEARGIGYSGPEKIRYSDIEAWARLRGRRPTAGDIELLLALDRLGFKVRAEGKR